MTVTSEVSRSGPYNGNGATTVFPYEFKIFTAADLLVTEVDLDGIETTLVNGVDYTVDGVLSDDGGDVTLTAALTGDGTDAGSHKLTIRRVLDATQTMNLRSQGKISAEVLERAHDRAIMLIQQLVDERNRSLRLIESEAGSELLTLLPPLAERKGRTQGYDATTGQPVMFSTANTAISAAMEAVVQAATLALARAAMGPWGDALVTSTGGSTARSLANRAADVQNVKDFGAVADGITNNTTFFQDAVDAMPSGGVLLIPPGDYAFTGTVELASNIAVVGIGRPILRLTSNPQTGIFHADGESDIDIQGVDFIGTNVSSAPATPERLVYLVNSSRLRVRDCGFSASIYGVHFQTCTDILVNGNIAHDIISHNDLSAGYGFLLALDCDRFSVSDNIFFNISRHAVYVSAGSSRGVIDGNTVNHCGSVALDVYATAAQNPCQDIVISNNVVRDIYGAVSPRGIGIAVNVRRISIVNNLIDTTVQYGIAVEGASGGLEGVDNPRQIRISGNEVFSPGINGIWCYSANDLVVEDNRIVGGATGIIINGNGASTGDFCRRASVHGNTLQDCTSYGLNISGAGVTACTLGNNTFRDCAINWNIPSNVPMSSWVYQGRTRTLPFHALAIAASATVNANGPAANIVYYVGEKALHALAISVRMTGAPTAGTVTFTITSNGSPVASLSVQFATGEYYKAVQIPPGTIILSDGTDIGVEVAASAGFTPSGTRNASISLTLGEAT